MLVTADRELVDITPGGSAEVVLDIRNTTDIIDGVTTRLIGAPAAELTSRPALLPLFPDASGQVTLSVEVPPGHPAGRHPVTVEVGSSSRGVAAAYLDLDLVVAARPRLTMACRPRLKRARRQARFAVQLTNTGNVALDVSFAAVDADRAVTTTFSPDRLRIEPGAVVTCLLTVRGPRMITGTELDRTVTVQATAVVAGAVLPDGPAVHYREEDDGADWFAELRAPAADAPLTDPGQLPDDPALTLPPIVLTSLVRLRQRPVLSKGLITTGVLAAIVALWAAVFLLGLNQAFKGEPMTKQAPASFFAGVAGRNSPVGANAAAETGGSPAGSLPKSGPLPAGVGAVLTGTVTATSNHLPAGRILVEALRRTHDGLQVVSSAATQSDGSYSLAGLFPTSYLIRYSAPGYRTVWYPAASSDTRARLVATSSEAVTSGIDARITGLPASIQGDIDPGDTLQQVTAQVQAIALVGKQTKPVASTITVGGKFVLSNLPAPGTYQLSFTAPGYQATTVVTTVGGGQHRYQSTVQLSVGPGQIGGLVTDGHAPLGAVVVSTTVAGKEVTVGTPTTGSVGSFVLANLPTPETYVLTFSAAGHGSQTSVVQLGPGQSRTDLRVVLAPGVGSVSGMLTDSAKQPLGGAEVSVGGAPTAMTTTTLTTGAVGYFSFGSLPAPGQYTLTFSLAGYADTTVPVNLSEQGAPPIVRVTMSTALGSIGGSVSGPDGAPLPGATVTATDGQHTWQVKSTSAGPGIADGGFLLTGLPPGSYSVTASQTGAGQQSALLTVTPGHTADQHFQLPGAS